MPFHVIALLRGIGEPVLVTTTHTRGSRRTALMRARWLDAVSQQRPSRQTYDMITPTGQPSRFAQMKVHSLCARSSCSSTSASRSYTVTSS